MLKKYTLPQSIKARSSLFGNTLRQLLSAGVVIILIATLLRQSASTIFSFGEDAYHQSLLLLEFINKPVTLVWIALPTMAIALGRRQLSWASFYQGRVIRILIMPLVIILAWTFAFYQYNYYFDHIHAASRTMIVILAGLSGLSPLFLPAFFALVMATAFQFDQPLGTYSWTDKQIVFDVLLIVIATLGVQNGFMAIRTHLTAFFFNEKRFKKDSYSKANKDWVHTPFIFFYLTVAVIIAYYVVPGLGKVQIKWHSVNQLYNIVFASYVNHWMAFLEPTFVTGLISWLIPLNPLFLWFTLFVEIGIIFILLHRRLLFIGLSACIALHIGIFTLTGIFFWKWIVLDGVVIWLGWKLTDSDGDHSFPGQLTGVPGWIASLLFAIVLAGLWRPPVLAWFDTPVAVTYDIEVRQAGGPWISYPRFAMAPYDIVFAQNRFGYLDRDRAFVGTYGAVGRAEDAQMLYNVKTPDDVEALVNNEGIVRFNPERTETFEEFLLRFFSNRNENPEIFSPISWASPPHHINNFNWDPVHPIPKTVDEVRMTKQRLIFINGEIQTLETATILEFDIE